MKCKECNGYHYPIKQEESNGMITITEWSECVDTPMRGKFEDWYKSYPNKKAVGEARKAFKGNIKTEETFNKLMEGTEGIVNFFSRNGKERKFIPHPATFIRAESYLDPDYNLKKKLDNNGKLCYSSQDELIDTYKCSKCGVKGIGSNYVIIEGKQYCSECSMKF